MTYQTDMAFSKLKNEIINIFKKINIEIFTNARWFQNKREEITCVEVYDYFIAAPEYKDLFVIPLIASFKIARSKKKLLYYIPIILTKHFKNKDYWLKITNRDYKAYIYPAINCRYYINIMESKQKIKTERNGYFLIKQTASNLAGEVSFLTENTSNSLTLIENDIVIKTYRKLNPGLSLDIEVAEILQEKTYFNNIPEFYGYIIYRDYTGQEYSICLLQKYIKNQQTLWQVAKNNLLSYFKKASKDSAGEYTQYIIDFKDEIWQVGRLIADLHIAFTDGFKSIYPGEDKIKDWVNEEKQVIRKIYRYLDKQKLENKIGSNKSELLKVVDKMYKYQQNLGKYIRIHGDLHLEQILRNNDGFIILDFEGEPLKGLEDRRKKYSPLKDIAGMLRSFAYISSLSYKEFVRGKLECKQERLIKAVAVWQNTISDSFLQGYLQQLNEKNKMDLIPPGNKLDKILAMFILEKALYETVYEINNRPDWVDIPLAGIRKCLEQTRNN